jgi:D-beta-D-heptose 7-phosphate kinase/D-beta-D-heptose 1-phosphate adenosyltransferase
MYLPINKLANRIYGKKIVIIGEAILDVFLIGDSTRLTREAPVPVVDIKEKKYISGGAANTAVNVSTLGGNATLISVIGNDLEGKILQNNLEIENVNISYLIRSNKRKTLSKQRIIPNDQMSVRFDQGNTNQISTSLQTKLINNLKKAANKADALIISDYGYGVITLNIIESIKKIAKKNNLYVAIDAKNPSKFISLNPDFVKPNYDDSINLLKIKPKTNDRIEQIKNNQSLLFKRTNAKVIATTLDKEGALIFEKNKSSYRTYTVPVPDTNTPGAGDTFISAFVLANISGASIPLSSEFATAASKVSVSQPGTTPARIEDLLNFQNGNTKYIPNRQILTQIRQKYREENKKIVFTNGCFDIIHSGHVTYLNQAKALGDILIVGVNSDDSVKKLKGQSRPINNLSERLNVLSGLSSIDHVIDFSELTPIELIKIVKPDIFVKGGDYSEDRLPEAPIVKSFGGKVEILPYQEGYSTTNIIGKIKSNQTKKVITPLPNHKVTAL